MRYYRIEILNQFQGWVTLPEGYKTQKEANDLAKIIAEEKRVPTRTKRAPKGWKPESSKI